MGLVKHHEEIGEKILSNLEVNASNADFDMLLKDLDAKHGNRLGGLKEFPSEIVYKKEWSSEQKVKILLGIIIERNKFLEEDLKCVRVEIREILSDKITCKKIRKKSPLVREIFESTQNELTLLRRQVEILKKKSKLL